VFLSFYLALSVNMVSCHNKNASQKTRMGKIAESDIRLVEISERVSLPQRLKRSESCHDEYKKASNRKMCNQSNVLIFN
jgi:hypothetical protein